MKKLLTFKAICTFSALLMLPFLVTAQKNENLLEAKKYTDFFGYCKEKRAILVETYKNATTTEDRRLANKAIKQFGRWEYPINQSSVGAENPITEALKTVKMSPNPIINGQTLTLTLPQEINTAKCSIYNYIGGQMATFEISSTNNNILLPSLSVGTYLVVIEHKGQQIGQPLLILK